MSWSASVPWDGITEQCPSLCYNLYGGIGPTLACPCLLLDGFRDLKELTERHHQEWILRLNLTQHQKTHQVQI